MSHRSPQQRVVMGVVLALLGLVFLLDNFHVFDARSVLAFWPVVLIVVGGLKLTQARRPSGYILGAGLLLAGVLLTLEHMGVLQVNWRDWWPVILIAVGTMVIFKGQMRHEDDSIEADARRLSSPDQRVDLTAVMSGSNLKVDSQDFRGGDISVVMGGVELDLRGACITRAATLQVFVAMGGIEIKVPTDWAVIVNGIPMLAGIEDKTVPPANPGKHLTITGYVIMGGVEIRN